MNAARALGQNKFGGHFYQCFWDVIKQEVFDATLQFFREGWIHPGLNSNAIILIHKFPQVNNIEYIKRIALANFQFMIITKILASRLSSIASKIISSQQRGFITGRQISYCIALTFEVINMLRQISSSP